MLRAPESCLSVVSFPEMPQKTIVVNRIRPYFLVMQNDSVAGTLNSLPYFVCHQYKAPEQQLLSNCSSSPPVAPLVALS